MLLFQFLKCIFKKCLHICISLVSNDEETNLDDQKCDKHFNTNVHYEVGLLNTSWQKHLKSLDIVNHYRSRDWLNFDYVKLFLPFYSMLAIFILHFYVKLFLLKKQTLNILAKTITAFILFPNENIQYSKFL